MLPKAKKSLGQNFLKSESALNKIIEAGEIEKDELILEIGPGQGALTEKLLAAGGIVIAIEVDREMIDFLNKKFKQQINSGRLTIFGEDILEIDPAHFDNLEHKKYKLISNIPYYITGEIIRKFLSSDNQPSKIVLLIQKEVADRIVAIDGKQSLLSISVQVYCEPKIVSKVRAGSFFPRPKVNSAIIKFDNISKKFFYDNKIDENIFFEVVKTGFAHKRKRLLSNLKDKFDFEEEKLIDQIKIDKNIRAEELDLEKWARIIKIIN